MRRRGPHAWLPGLQPVTLAKALRKHMAALGAKGGQTTGAAKARDPEHYKRLADMRRAKAAARHVTVPQCPMCGCAIWAKAHPIGEPCDACYVAHAQAPASRPLPR